ncbi:RDD family protein [Dokdonella sp. MW10]|uniref:RDD family protein n=1 Tax=Dokdonella sp. MW10 TaxID=2992926 RepID=UPI003F7D0382
MSATPPASLWRRLAAASYDLLVLVAVWMLVAALVLAAFHGDVDVAHQPPLYHAVLQAALLAATALYFAISWSRGGQTIGMRAWRVRVVGGDGRPPSFLRALARFGVAIASTLAAGLGFAWCLVDRERRAWHDIASATSLVHMPPR